MTFGIVSYVFDRLELCAGMNKQKKTYPTSHCVNGIEFNDYGTQTETRAGELVVKMIS